MKIDEIDAHNMKVLACVGKLLQLNDDKQKQEMLEKCDKNMQFEMLLGTLAMLSEKTKFVCLASLITSIDESKEISDKIKYEWLSKMFLDAKKCAKDTEEINEED